MFTATRPARRAARPEAEWGPAKHDPDHPLRPAGTATAGAVALRDGDDALPDDN